MVTSPVSLPPALQGQVLPLSGCRHPQHHQPLRLRGCQLPLGPSQVQLRQSGPGEHPLLVLTCPTVMGGGDSTSVPTALFSANRTTDQASVLPCQGFCFSSLDFLFCRMGRGRTPFTGTVRLRDPEYRVSGRCLAFSKCLSGRWFLVPFPRPALFHSGKSA